MFYERSFLFVSQTNFGSRWFVFTTMQRYLKNPPTLTMRNSMFFCSLSLSFWNISSCCLISPNRVRRPNSGRWIPTSVLRTEDGFSLLLMFHTVHRRFLSQASYVPSLQSCNPGATAELWELLSLASVTFDGWKYPSNENQAYSTSSKRKRNRLKARVNLRKNII